MSNNAAAGAGAGAGEKPASGAAAASTSAADLPKRRGSLNLSEAAKKIQKIFRASSYKTEAKKQRTWQVS
jgi:hypothetical protein